MLGLAAQLQHAMQEYTGDDGDHISRQGVGCVGGGGVVCHSDPFKYMRPWSDADVHGLVHKVHPYVYRLLCVLKSIDHNKYKSTNIPWMVLGMLYMCTSGMVMGSVQVLPAVPELRTILPSDNRILFYFGSLGITTKCVTDTSNMIAVSLKNNAAALRHLQHDAWW